jgi:hypothetical protein
MVLASCTGGHQSGHSFNTRIMVISIVKVMDGFEREVSENSELEPKSVESVTGMK